jgi:hypothetical protein
MESSVPQTPAAATATFAMMLFSLFVVSQAPLLPSDHRPSARYGMNFLKSSEGLQCQCTLWRSTCPPRTPSPTSCTPCATRVAWTAPPISSAGSSPIQTSILRARAKSNLIQTCNNRDFLCLDTTAFVSGGMHAERESFLQTLCVAPRMFLTPSACLIRRRYVIDRSLGLAFQRMCAQAQQRHSDFACL